MSIEFSPGPDGKKINTTQILVAADLARLKALADPESGVVRVDYLLIPELKGARSSHVTNIATRDHGAAEYAALIHEVAGEGAQLEISNPIDIKNKVE